MGGAIGGALLLAAAFWAFRYRKQQKQKALDVNMLPPLPPFHEGYRDSHPQTYYVDSSKAGQFSPTAEMMDQGHQKNVRPELPG